MFTYSSVFRDLHEVISFNLCLKLCYIAIRIMGRGKKLSESEISTILALRKQKLSITQIAKEIHRSRKVIYNLLKDTSTYGKKKSTGRPAALSECDTRAIIRAASNSCATAREIAKKAGVETNIQNVRRVLQTNNIINRTRIIAKPSLNAKHKEARLLFAKAHVHWKKTWRKVIFTDEKRFNLDGPDGCTYYYHDTRKQPLTKIRRQMHGGGVMIWAGVGYNGKTEIKFIHGTMNSARYLELIKNQIYTYAESIAVTPYIFQQDNAAVHTAKSVKEYFLKENISTLQWPACSPDLNIIENCWAMLSQGVYAEGRQFSNINELKTCITTEWENLAQAKIKDLYHSLPKRMVEVIENKGGSTHY